MEGIILTVQEKSQANRYLPPQMVALQETDDMQRLFPCQMFILSAQQYEQALKQTANEVIFTFRFF